MLNPLNFLRRMAAQAVLNGTADAIRTLVPDDEPTPTDLAELRQFMANATQPKQLTAGAAEVEPAKKRKN